MLVLYSELLICFESQKICAALGKGPVRQPPTTSWLHMAASSYGRAEAFRQCPPAAIPASHQVPQNRNDRLCFVPLLEKRWVSCGNLVFLSLCLSLALSIVQDAGLLNTSEKLPRNY